MIRIKNYFLLSLLVSNCFVCTILPRTTTGGGTGENTGPVNGGGSVVNGGGGQTSGTGGNVTPSTTPKSSLLTPASQQLYANIQSTDSVAQTSAAFMRHTKPGTTTAEYKSNPQTAGALQVTPKTKHSLAPGVSLVTQSANMSFTKKKTNVVMNPTLLQSNSTLDSLYQKLIISMQNNALFVPTFTKFHISTLHQIYQYLMGIYVALTMTHIDDLQTYLTLESTYALNKKTLIIGHFIELIEAQLNQALQALMPGMPQQYATITGPSLLENDSATKLEVLLVDMESVACSVVNITAVTIAQWQEVLTALTDPKNVQYFTALSQPTLQSIVGKLTTYVQANSTASSFIAQLSYSQDPTQVTERGVLIEALALLSANAALTQELVDLSNLIIALRTIPLSSTPFTYGQTSILTAVVQTLAFNGELAEIMNALARIQTQIQANPVQPLSASDQAILLNVIAFALFYFEQQSASSVSYLINALENLLKTETLTSTQTASLAPLNVLTEFQQSYLQNLATALLAHTRQLDNLSQSDRTLLARGLLLVAANPPASASSLMNPVTNTASPLDTTTLQALGTELAQNPIPEEVLSNAQEVAYQQALGVLAAYAPSTGYTLTPAINDMTTQYSQDVVDQLSDLLSNTGGAAALKSLSIDQQIMALNVFETFGRAFQDSFLAHQQTAASINNLLQGQAVTLSALYNALDADTYQALLDVYAILSTNPLSALSATQMTTLTSVLTIFKAPLNVTPSMPPNPQVIGDVVQSPTTTPGPTIGILDLLSIQSFSNTALQQLATNAGQVAPYANLGALCALIQKPNVAPASFQVADASYLLSQLNSYQGLLKANPPTQVGALQPANASDFDMIASMLSIYNGLDTNQKAYFSTVGAYLSFFNNYTNLLNTNLVTAEQQTSQSSSTGITEFAKIAQSIQTSLQNSPLGSLNPSIFFYDAKTMKALTIIPVLGSMVDGTSSVPYPTFGVDVAVSALNPSTNISSSTAAINQSNQIFISDGSQQVSLSVPSCEVKVGSTTFSPRFFFKDSKGVVSCNTGTLPAWIQKINVPASAGATYSYLYMPTRATVDQEGLYMNIPIASSDPNAANSSLIRLYEQPIYAQPTWLNSVTGIMTMLRGCLGDFASLLTLPDSILDPCLQLILRRSISYATGLPPAISAFAYEKSNPQVAVLENACTACLAQNYGIATAAQNGTQSAGGASS